MSKLIIQAGKQSWGQTFSELKKYKDLFFILAYRDFKVRYAQTFLGVLWGVIQPALTLLIFTLVFGKALKLPSTYQIQVPYPLFALSGMIVWMYFAFVMSNAGNSIISSQSMIQKIYFPRLIIPLSKALVGITDFLIGLVFLTALLIVYGFVPSSNIVFLPVFLIFLMMASLGVGIWLSALTIRFRDFQQIVPFMVQFGLYATPIGYPAQLILANEHIADFLKILYFLNPVAGITEGFRWCIIGGELPVNYVSISLVVSLFLFITSLFYFRSIEKVMADIV